MPVVNSRPAHPATCQHCGAPTSATRSESGWIAVGLAGMVVGIFAAAGHESLTSDVSPRPVGLYVVVIGAAVAALWLIARAFTPQH